MTEIVTTPTVTEATNEGTTTEEATDNTAAETVVDTKPEGTEEAPVKPEIEAKKDPMHSKLAALSRRENALWKKEKEIKSLEAELKTRSETEASTKELYKKDPMKLMTDYGLTYEMLIDAAIGAPQKEEAPEVKQLREKLEAIESRETERQKAVEKERIRGEANTYAADLKTFVDATEGKYELIKETNNYQLVLDTLVEKYQSDGEEVAWDVAADWVENYLEEEYETNLTKLLSVGKIRKLLKLEAAEEAAQETVTKPKVSTKTADDIEGLEDEELRNLIDRKKEEMKQRFTLSNKDMSSTSPVTNGKLTRDERLERAKALEKQLSS